MIPQKTEEAPPPSVQPTPPRIVGRYTRFVHSTKVGLGLFSLLLIGVVLFYPLFRQQNAGVRISLTSTNQKNTVPTTMNNAHFQGFDKDNQPYNLTAATAAEVDEEHINFTKPTGDIVLKNGQRFSVDALSGDFDKKEHLLHLKGDIHMSNNQGYTLQTDSLQVDITHKTAATSAEVHGKGALGTLKSYGGAIADEVNQLIVFEGPVFVTLNMKNNHPASEEKPK